MNLSFDPLNQNYCSRRYPIYAVNGMVNCSNPLAASAGLSILQKGGNAMDAAVAAAAALTVVEPTSNGIGSDAFALIWSEKNRKLFGINSSGRAPMLAAIDKIKDEGKDENGRMPARGWTPVTVPGAPAAWAEINRRFGNLSLSQVVAPAVQYAREGFPLSPNIAENWRKAYEAFKRDLQGECYEAWFRTFAPHGRPYKAGEMVYLTDHARSLSLIGETNAEAFYTGELAKRIDERRAYGRTESRPEAELCICAARTAKGIWYPSSSPIIWDSAPGSWLTGQASLSRTEARISRWIRTTSTALCPASEPITRSFPVF